MGLIPRDPTIEPADALAIHDLVADYSFYYDGRAFADFAALFTEDGRLETPAGGGIGRPEIEAWATSRWSEMLTEGHTPRHFQTNTRLRYVDADQVSGRTQLLLIWVDRESGAPELKFVADYLDDFRRTQDGWRFARRRIAIDKSHP